MNRKTLICIAVIIATVFPVCIYCFQIPLGKLLGPEIIFVPETNVPYGIGITERSMITRSTMVITLTLVCETIASFIFAYALTQKK